MQARQMLIDGEIHPTDWMQAARFVALASQAEGIKHPSDLLSDNHQKYFHNLSLRIQKVKLSEQVRDKASRKSFVDAMKADSDNEKECENSHLEKFIMENYVEHMIVLNDTESHSSEIATASNVPDDFFLLVAREHQRIQTMTPASAKYWLLEEFATVKKFGEEMFEGTLISETNSNSKAPQPRSETVQIAVSPQGLRVRKIQGNEAFSIPFSAVESAKSLRRCFHLCFLDEDFAVSNLVVKFASHRIAGTLYRSLTEKHAFYSCETVHKNVETQFIRDLKVRLCQLEINCGSFLKCSFIHSRKQGTIISMFNEDTELGKKYVFDIRLTFRELYDNSRRILHSRGVDVSANPSNPEDSGQTSSEPENKRIDLTCSICMDQKIDTLFLPCAHLSCCRSCAQK